ncbi:GAF domain-containing protein [Streptomyces sp. WAC05374]|uniref:SpoIIE family protein phosphatase/ATP-binding protein n=1 Tax=Streptomyces sp. WAC05374 TaxID=2487420 RepID=UPI000F86C208|nr:GAF domain-containing protein [Streptomyces sp. WAC05374]TDF50519.1 GAF domain-containing protein [Streptomyces sp. WAC05374]TDF56808.1 GAF domain-containing protein [Streptomyces sp. WAC05374]TDF60771.1 GAF domain-containing protein [Streptomyces sp. WAC05374]
MSGRLGRTRRASGRPSPGRAPRAPHRLHPGMARRPRQEGVRSLLGVRTVAGQVLLLQILVAVLLITAAVTGLAFQARYDSERDAQNRSLAAAQSFAEAPGVATALRAADPTAALQESTRKAKEGSGLDFIAVMTPDGVRVADNDPTLIGRRAEQVERAAAGSAFTEIFEGAPNDAARAVVPVIDSGGTVVGLVSAGVSIENVGDAVNRHLPVLLGSAGAALALAVGSSALVSRRLRRQTRGLGPTEMTRMYEHHDAVLHAAREGVLIIGDDGRLTLANDEARRLLELPPDAEGRHVTGLGLDAGMAELLASGRTVTDEVHLAGDRLLAVNTRPTAPYGGASGTVATLRDTTELRAVSGMAEVARERLKLLYEAGGRIGTTLDVVRTAEELSEVTVPRFADFVTVELLDPVLRGEEPAGAHTEMRRTAVSGIRDDHPLQPVGDLIRFAVPTTPMAAALASGHAVLEPDLNVAHGWRAQDPAGADQALAYGIHSLVTVPLQARGVVLGMANFWRAERAERFEEDDLAFAEELAARAAVAIDNARRFTREHAMAVTLQRSLLPRVLPEQGALDIAYRYLPAQAGVGGDWFDVIPLPGARVALVVGDVVGHGLHAAATMGRLRTAVHNFSALDLPPDELLGHLDELVSRIDQEEGADGDGDGITGATCLYAIYDPASGRCSVATAGHFAPVLVRPDGTVDCPEVPVFPPLGLGGLPFETAELDLREGSRLVLYTDGLIEHRHRDLDTGLRVLRDTLAGHPDRTPEETCQAVFGALLPAHRRDDIALLVARTNLLDRARVADWDVPPDPSAVARVRAACGRQLEEWGLDDLGFTTELMLSELITNAIRYGSEPIHVRMLYERCLICEVSDGSSTSPHLRRAATTDEGGRGLFLVSQLAERWGTRYTPTGKVMWTEQSPGTEPRQPMELVLDDVSW